MSADPAISIIVPMHNAEATIERTLESVRAQTFQDYEVLIVDDASTDQSRRRVEEYVLQPGDDRFVLVPLERNGGPARARNLALAQARGTFVCFLDADDEYLPTFLEVLHSQFTPDVDVVMGGHFVITSGDAAATDDTVDGVDGLDGGGPKLGEPTEALPDALPDALSGQQRGQKVRGTLSGKAALAAALTDRIQPFMWDKMYRRTLVAQVPFPEDLKRFEDMVVTAGLMARSRQVVSVATPLTRYFVSANSLTWGKAPSIDEANIAIAKLKEVIPPQKRTGAVLRQLSVATLLIKLLLAQSIIMKTSESPEERHDLLRQVRTLLSFREIFHTVLIAPKLAIGAALLKLAPQQFAKLYENYSARQYGIDRQDKQS